MKVANFRELDKVSFVYPELMSKDAELKVKNLFVEIQLTEDLLAEANKVSDELRARLKYLRNQWAALQSLVDVTFKTEEKKEIKNDVNLGFNFSADINKNIH